MFVGQEQYFTIQYVNTMLPPTNYPEAWVVSQLQKLWRLNFRKLSFRTSSLKKLFETIIS